MFSKLKTDIRMAKLALNAFEKNTSGESPVKALVTIFVVAVLAGALLPTGIDSVVAGSNGSGTWTAAETATYGIIAIMLIIAVIMLIIRVATE